MGLDEVLQCRNFCSLVSTVSRCLLHTARMSFASSATFYGIDDTNVRFEGTQDPDKECFAEILNCLSHICNANYKTTSSCLRLYIGASFSTNSVVSLVSLVL